MDINHILVDMQKALKIQEAPAKGNIADFKKQKQEGTKLLIKGAIQKLLQETKNYPEAYVIAQKIAAARNEEIPKYIEQLADLAAEEPEQKRRSFKMPKLPNDIKEDVVADLQEIQKCLNSECYRSAVILCGRVMETALHRKYYEATGNDLLEKAPGTGLGTLIAKLSEHGVKLDPGLPNQIHLINQIRVFSVHTKKESFSPSKTQTEAIVLYTLDILDKLFK